MPNVEQILSRLASELPDERLKAARFLAEHATPEHEGQLREALARESVQWIRSALKRAIKRLSSTATIEESTSAILNTEDAPERFAAQVYAEALEESTSHIIHEVEPLVGLLRMACEREIGEKFEASSTRQHLDRLDALLDTIARLRRAASAPVNEEFALDELVMRLVQDANPPAGVAIHKSGPQPLVVQGDSSLITLCLANGLRNAIEATSALNTDLSSNPINVTWGQTDIDNWIAVVDVGIGFKGNLQRAFEMGTTTKSGHLGMGLAIARQAISSLSGKLMLVPSERGMKFEMRWPTQHS